MDAMVALNPLGNDKTKIDTFIRLYQDYIDELRIYDPTIDKLGPHQIAEVFLVPELDIHLIVLNEAVIGFTIHQLLYWETAKPTFYIAEFYIIPAYRRSGCGKQAAHLLLQMNPFNHVFWYVIRKNEPARLFWNEVVAAERLIPESRSDIKDEDTCAVWAFLVPHITRKMKNKENCIWEHQLHIPPSKVSSNK